MNFWENDPIATIDATTGDDWWSDDPVVSGKPEIGGVERSALNALQFGINSSAEALDYKNQYEEESPEWLTGVPKPSRYTKLAELETAFESTPKGYKSKGGIPVWENTGREMAMERTRVKVAEKQAAEDHAKFKASGLSADEYAQQLERERLLRENPSAKLPPIARAVATGGLNVGDKLSALFAKWEGDTSREKKLLQDVRDRSAANAIAGEGGFFRNTSGPIGSVLKAGEYTANTIDPAAEVLTEAGLTGAAGGIAGTAAYYATTTTHDLYDQTGDLSYALTGGAIEGAMTLVGGKLLGAGVGKFAERMGGKATGSLLGRVVDRAARRSGVRPLYRAATPMVVGAGGEVIEENVTELMHATNEYLTGNNPKAFENIWERLWETTKVSGIAGAGGGATGSAGKWTGLRSRKELARNMKRVADEIKQASKGIESAVTVIESQPETAKEPIPVPPTSRNGFEKATGKTRTSEAEREAHKDTIEAYNKARDEFFGAVDTLSAEETEERAKAIQKRAKEWIGRDYTDYVTDKNGKERKRKVADPELVERINGLIESDPEVAEGILDTAESMYRELGEDVNAPLKEAIRGYFLDNRGLNSFRSKVKRASDPAGVKDFDELMDHLRRATTTVDQLNYRGMADAIDESQVFDLLKYGWDRTYTGKARALRKALDYYDDQLTRPGNAEPVDDGGFGQEPIQTPTPEQTAPTEQQPTQAPESPPTAPQPEVAPVQGEAVEVRPEAEIPLPGADIYPDVIRENRPGSRVVQRGANDWEVYHPDGSFTRHQLVSRIPYRSERHVKHSLLAHGLKDTPENRKKLRDMGATAQFTLSTPDGVMVDGRGVIKVVATANKARLTIKDRHEVLHDLIAWGQMTDAEFDTLAKEYSDPAKPRKQQEEDIANASKGWKKDGSIRAMIKAIVNRLLHALHLTVLKPATARDSYFSGRMARRPRLTHAEATAKMVGETNEMLSQPAMQSNEALSMEQVDDEAPIWTHTSRRIVEQKMGAKSNPIALMAMLKNNGVKEEEIEWMGLKELLGNNRKSVTKEEVLAAIEHGVQLEETLRGERPKSGPWYRRLNPLGRTQLTDPATGEVIADNLTNAEATEALKQSPKFSYWQLPGGENYRELLLTLPPPAATPPPLVGKIERIQGNGLWRYTSIGNLISVHDTREEAEAEQRELSERLDSRSPAEKRPGSFVSSHFDEPNILAHIRFNERTDAEGKRVLFIEEIQSDWHQAGKKQGYAINNQRAAKAVDAGGYWEVTDEQGNFITNVLPYEGEFKTAEDAIAEANRRLESGAAFSVRRDTAAVPDAPFKKSWPLLSMKRMIRWAADNGFDKIAWTTGAQQAERYDLSKQVDSIKVEAVEEAEGVFFVDIKPSGGRTINLEVENGVVREGEFEGKPLDEVIGKEMANKILAVSPGNTQTFSGDGLKMGGEGMHGFYDRILPAETNKFIKKWGAKVGRSRFAEIPGKKPTWNYAGTDGTPAFDAHAFDITDSMRESAIGEGMSMFSLDDTLFDKGGPQDDRYLGRANTIQRQPERHEAYLQAEQHGPPSHKDRATAEQQAQALIMGDYQGQLKKWLEASKRSRDAGGLSIHETMTDAAVVRKLIFSELSKGLRGDKQAYANSQLLNVYGWIDARSEEARIHSMRDPLADTAFGRQEALLAAYAGMTGESPIQKGITFKPGEAAELGPTNIGTNQTEFIDTEEGKQHAKTEDSLEKKQKSIDPKKLDKALKYAGIDLSQMTFDEVAADVGLTLRAMNVFHALNANIDSKVHEFWRNSILSAAKTMLVNAGGSAYGIYHTVGERLAAGAVNTVLRRKGEATLGEMSHVIAGFLPGVMRGLRNAAISWYHEIPALEIEQGRLTHEQIIGREGMLRGAIAGRKGWWIRTPFRTLSATDQFVKTILYEMEVAGLAYRNGKAQGLKGEALGRYMASETGNPMSDTAIQAYLEAKHGVFQGDPGIVAHGFGGVVSTVRKVKGVGKYAAPFKETPASVFEQISKRTPVIGAVVDYANHRRNQKLNPEMRAEAEQVQLSEAVARQLIALTGLAVVWAMNDPDDPWITGTYSEEQSYKPYPPQSIYIPGYGWASYSRVEPFSGMLASTVDFSNSLRSSKSKATVPVDMLASMGRQFSEKTYVQGIADLAVFGQGLMTFDEKKLREGAKLPANIAVGFVPNVYRDTVKSIRNEVAERRAWGKGGDYWTHYAKRMAQDAQLHFDAQPKVDTWGRDIKPYMDNTNFMFRVLAPTRTMDQSTVLPMDEAVYAWNAQRPAKPAEFTAPQTYWREDGETHYLTDEQFYIRSKVAGLYAKKLADGYLKRGWKLNTEKPTENDIEVILGAVKRGKSTATSLLKPYWKKGQSGEQVLQRLETAAPSTGTPRTP